MYPFRQGRRNREFPPEAGRQGAGILDDGRALCYFPSVNGFPRPASPPFDKGLPVRVISGSAKGKRLAAFPGGTIRPTPDRVREALFSILFSRLGPLEGKTVLDLFAGTGAMALEALSRGCRRAVLVDQSQEAARIIPANLKTCGLEERVTHIRADVLQILPRLKNEGPFDLIFLDPPYGRDLVPKVIKSACDLELLAPRGVVCAESARDDAVPETIGELIRVDERRYGSTSIHLFTRPESEAEAT